jgi:hypothetical protein
MLGELLREFLAAFPGQLILKIVVAMNNLAVRALRKAKRLLIGNPLPPLEPKLAALERVFRAPPMTRKLRAAIKPISPQFDLGLTERDRAYWETDQNGASWAEYGALKHILSSVPKNGKILEVGPGLGRSMVFFAKKFGWSDLSAYEGDGTKTKYTYLGPRFEDSFCGNLEMLRHCLDFNGLNNATIFDASEIKLSEIPGKYDLLYSFYCIGFHWSIEHFMDDILRLLKKDGLGIFTTTLAFVPPPCFNLVRYEIIDYTPSYPVGTRYKLIALRPR